MKMCQLCAFLAADDIYIMKNGRLLMHIEGADALRVVANVYEYTTVCQVVPTGRSKVKIIIAD